MPKSLSSYSSFKRIQGIPRPYYGPYGRTHTLSSSCRERLSLLTRACSARRAEGEAEAREREQNRTHSTFPKGPVICICVLRESRDRECVFPVFCGSVRWKIENTHSPAYFIFDGLCWCISVWDNTFFISVFVDIVYSAPASAPDSACSLRRAAQRLEPRDSSLDGPLRRERRAGARARARVCGWAQVQVHCWPPSPNPNPGRCRRCRFKRAASSPIAMVRAASPPAYASKPSAA